ncbi:hypothetical protein ACLOJK_032407 [Asimina triloba]
MLARMNKEYKTPQNRKHYIKNRKAGMQADGRRIPKGRKVRSFGTEGRKKDGPQIPPSDKVYEYILFRGSDIKDLQVKSSPPVQSAPPSMPPIHSDPAIIQSHYPQPLSTTSSLPSAGSGTMVDLSSHAAQLGLPRSPFQGGLPLYQPGGSLGSWGSSPSPQNGSGIPMPMYWQGYYGPLGGLSPLQQQQQQNAIRPPPGLPMPQSMQQQPMQHPNMNSSLPTGGPNLMDYPSPLLPPVSNSTNITSAALPSTLAPVQSAALASDISPSLMPSKAPVISLPSTTQSTNLTLVSPLTSTTLDINSIMASSKPRPIPGPSLPYQSVSQSVSAIAGPSTSGHTETSVPPLVTPGQLLQSGPTTLSSPQPLQTGKDVEAVQATSSEPSASSPASAPSSVIAETQAPILPLPTVSEHKISHGVTKFTEDFDFMAMNEKFKKDEVWGHLGKSKVRDKEGEAGEDGVDDTLEDDDAESSRFQEKPVYVKDDFFDTLSCNALDRGSRNGRTKFSEQMKIDTETFGDFPRHRGGGGRGPGRGGGWSRGPFYGRGYGYLGRGYGYLGRGRVVGADAGPDQRVPK